ncbi:MAG: iron ABC transporter permease [Pseudomonadota bacterium]|nr:iron ABC transporter permease [Pseudomonadota bacterium]
MAISLRALRSGVTGNGLFNKRNVLSLILILALGSVTVVPVLFLVISSFNVADPGQATTFGLGNWIEAFDDSRILDAIWTTFSLVAARLSIGVLAGILFAWLIARTDMPGGTTFEFLFWIAFFSPALPLTLGWILLLDPENGVINSLFGSHFDIFTFWGIVWVHLTATTIPVAVILFTPAFRQMSAVLEDSARMCGASALGTLRRITVPLLIPAILPATAIMLIRSLEAFEIELLLGSPVGIFVYSTRIYDLIDEVPAEYGMATALGTLFLFAVFVMAALYALCVRGRRFTTVTGQGYSTERIKLGRWRWPAFALCTIYLSVSFGLGMVFLFLSSFMRRFGFFDIKDPFTLEHWRVLFDDPILLSSLWNSLLLGACTAVAGVILFSLVAYVVVRSRITGKGVIDILAWLPWAIPGVLMGLALVWLYLETPLRVVFYGTIAGLVVAMLIKELPVGVQLLKAGFIRLGDELEEAARVCGASWSMTYVKVILPLVAPVLATVAVLSFQAAVRDIASVVFLYDNDSRPLSILMLEYSFSGEMERGAAAGILLVIMITIMAVIARWLGHRSGTSS